MVEDQIRDLQMELKEERKLEELSDDDDDLDEFSSDDIDDDEEEGAIQQPAESHANEIP